MTTTAYSSLIDDFAVVTAAHPAENELGAAAFATHAVLAPQPTEGWRRARLQRTMEAFGPCTASSVFRCPASGVLAHQDWLTLTGRRVIHEGFLVDPLVEDAAALDALKAHLGEQLWYTPPAAWLRWGSKVAFRRRCRELLGAKAQPRGTEIVASECGDVDRALEAFRRDPADTVIVKFPGIGGAGNIMVCPATVQDWRRAIADQWHRFSPAPVDVVIEEWMHWNTTQSVSYLLPPQNQPPQVVAVCQQLVDRRRARFVGSRSSAGMSPDDLEALLDWLAPVISAMHHDGCVGVVAIDVIIGAAARWGLHGHRLPSGKRVNVIECNPRFNRHNRVGLLVERLARLWHLPPDDLQWTLIDRYPPDSVTFSHFTTRLHEDSLPPPPGHARILFVDRQDRAMQLAVRPRS